MSPPLLSAVGLRAVAGARTLFDELDVVVRGGELVAVTGPNGAGKSTLLRLLLRLRRPVRGLVQGAPGVAVGYVPQLDPDDPGLPFPAINVVLQGLPRLRFSPFSARRAHHAARAALDRAGYAAPASRRYGLLSGGERRRVLLARALVARPGLLILDEPTAGIDVDGEREFIELVLREVREGVGAIWVCHGLGMVEEAADRVVRLGGDA